MKIKLNLYGVQIIILVFFIELALKVIRDQKDPEGRGISWEQIEKFEAIPDPAR